MFPALADIINFGGHPGASEAENIWYYKWIHRPFGLNWVWCSSTLQIQNIM